MLYEGKYSLSEQLLTESIEITDDIMRSFREFLAEPDRIRKGDLGESLVRFFHQSGQGGNLNEPGVFEHFKYYTHHGEQLVNPSSKNRSFPLCDFASNQVTVENILGRKPRYSKTEVDYEGNPEEIRPGHPKVAFYSIKATNTFTTAGAGKRGSQSSPTNTSMIESFLNKGQRGGQMQGIKPYLDAAFPNGQGYVLLGAYCVSPKTDFDAIKGTGRREATGIIIKKNGPKLWRIKKALPTTANFSQQEFIEARWEIQGGWIDIGRSGAPEVLENNFGQAVIIGESGYEGRPEKFMPAGSRQKMRRQDRSGDLRHDLNPGFRIR